MKKNLPIIMGIIFVIAIITISMNMENKTKAEPKVLLMSGKHQVAMTFKDYGTVTLELDGDEAPTTVSHFIDLVKSGFYDGLTIHRVHKDFVIQGGDPEGNGTGGAERNVVGEFTANNYNNSISHTRGTISMARNSSDMNSASSQFFIVLKDATYLDGQYAGFGHVIDGMDIIDKINKDKAKYAINEMGLLSKVDQVTIEKVKVLN
jgi:peptidyl-prolyl cis-trans isomerase B (cyclophilin B)